MARGNFDSTVRVEMIQREIKQRCRTDTDVDDLKAGRDQSGNDSLGVTFGSSPAISANTDAGTTGLIDNCAVHFAKQKSKIFIELFLCHTADVVFAKDR